ncbi:MAG: hypothetical protein KDJ65_18035 [Anaerolineae bacterium]|nr:hypothetical protein [Anaerolineae bacterium]
MAKSRRSRRVRRQESEKPVPSPAAPAPQVAAPVEKKATPAASRTTVDFAREYYYVYAELRQILLVTAIMFAAMIGLSFFI